MSVLKGFPPTGNVLVHLLTHLISFSKNKKVLYTKKAQFNLVFLFQIKINKCDRLIHLRMSVTNLCVTSEKLLQL